MKMVTYFNGILSIIPLVSVFFIVAYCWSRRRLFFLSWKLPGPLALPVIGNAYIFLRNSEDQLLRTVDIIKSYSSPMRFWLGSNLIISFRHPSQVQKILSSSNLTYKHDIYEFMKTYFGEGLLCSSGHKWKIARRLTQPMFGLNFVSKRVDLFKDYISYTIDRFDELSTNDYFDVETIIHKTVVDLVGEIILGSDLETRKGENRDFLESLSRMYDLIITRMMKPWLHFDFLFNLTRFKIEEDQVLKSLSNVFDKHLQFLQNGNRRFTPITAELAHEFRYNSNLLDDLDFKNNIMTLFAASEDTITLIVSGALVAFGMYPEIQEKAFKEIENVSNSSEKFISYDDIVKMEYLDMCIKDVLRIFPVAHLILRKTLEDCEIDDLTIPKGCAIAISIFNLHLDPEFWEKPMEFYPEHFLPEAVRKRPTFTYIPFSAGPRGCIGKIFAHTVIKMYVANILWKFKVEAKGKYVDQFKDFKADISVRPRKGYHIRICRRY